VQNEAVKNKVPGQTAKTEVSLDIAIYTDPLCCWSWAFQPELEKIKTALHGIARWQTYMGGLIPSWNNFHDEVNSITRPIQMGPLWMHAGQIAQRSINHLLWMKDPPGSSYPACIAVKAAQLQSADMGEIMLQHLREAAMSQGLNTAKREVIMAKAELLAKSCPDFSIKKFREDYEGEAGPEALRKDLEQVKYFQINRFPTLIIKSENKKAILLSGYRPYAQVLQKIQVAFPDLEIL
jgi:putative protein-disulfide isomerase